MRQRPAIQRLGHAVEYTDRQRVEYARDTEQLSVRYLGMVAGRRAAIVATNGLVERGLWEAADELRANSRLRASEYSVPVLGLIFLRFADHKFAQARRELAATAQAAGSRRMVGKADYQARPGVVYRPEQARFAAPFNLPEGENTGKAINDAMRAIEAENEGLRDVLPKTYNRLENATPVAWLKTPVSPCISRWRER